MRDVKVRFPGSHQLHAFLASCIAASGPPWGILPTAPGGHC